MTCNVCGVVCRESMLEKVRFWLDDTLLWVKVKWHLWRHRNDTPDQHARDLEKAKRDLHEAIQDFKDSEGPADKDYYTSVLCLEEVEQVLK